MSSHSGKNIQTEIVVKNSFQSQYSSSWQDFSFSPNRMRLSKKPDKIFLVLNWLSNHIFPRIRPSTDIDSSIFFLSVFEILKCMWIDQIVRQHASKVNKRVPALFTYGVEAFVCHFYNKGMCAQQKKCNMFARYDKICLTKKWISSRLFSLSVEVWRISSCLSNWIWQYVWWHVRNLQMCKNGSHGQSFYSS